MNPFDLEELDPAAYAWPPSESAPPEDELTVTANEYRERQVHEQAERLRIADAARALVAAERVGRIDFPTPVGLGDFIAAHAHEQTEWLIRDLWPLGGRVMFTAPAKGGKTTMTGNLIRALADGDPFLSAFPVTNAPTSPGSIVVLDTEMTEGTLSRWLQALDVHHHERVRVVPLRGRTHTLNPTEPANRARWVPILAGADVVILDPVGAVLSALNLEENSSTDVGRFLTGWDALMLEAGVSNSLISHHHGHSGERARGSSKFADSCDALWTLTRKGDAEDAPRFFRAMGRDVSVPEGALDFTPSTRLLSYMAGSRGPSESEAHDQKVSEIVAVMDQARMSADVSRVQLREFLKERGMKARNEVLAEAIRKRKERQ
ncbi:AAA family ATPase [Micrococcus luteus]|uniref:AAA family ATPase n=1 Tax=Micrococcus luteus TaxID=1270 RepID=UPI0036368364